MTAAGDRRQGVRQHQARMSHAQAVHGMPPAQEDDLLFGFDDEALAATPCSSSSGQHASCSGWAEECQPICAESPRSSFSAAVLAVVEQEMGGQQGEAMPKAAVVKGMAAAIARSGFVVALCSTVPCKARPLQNLHNTFVVVREAAGSGCELLLDVAFRSHFELPTASSAYVRLLQAEVPEVWLGPRQDMALLVRRVARLMAAEYRQQQLPLPPWRTEAALLSLWRESRTMQEQAAIEHPATEHPASGTAAEASNSAAGADCSSPASAGPAASPDVAANRVPASSAAPAAGNSSNAPVLIAFPDIPIISLGSSSLLGSSGCSSGGLAHLTSSSLGGCSAPVSAANCSGGGTADPVESLLFSLAPRRVVPAASSGAPAAGTVEFPQRAPQGAGQAAKGPSALSRSLSKLPPPQAGHGEQQQNAERPSLPEVTSNSPKPVQPLAWCKPRVSASPAHGPTYNVAAQPAALRAVGGGFMPRLFKVALCGQR